MCQKFVYNQHILEGCYHMTNALTGVKKEMGPSHFLQKADLGQNGSQNTGLSRKSTVGMGVNFE